MRIPLVVSAELNGVSRPVGTIDIDVADPVPTDDLCPTCLLPSVWMVEAHHITDDGVADVMTNKRYCDECETFLEG